MLREAELLRTEGLTAPELKRAQAKILGQKKISRQDLGGLALTTALDEIYGLGFGNLDQEDARYAAVTLEQVQAVAEKYLRPESLVVAVVRPEKVGLVLALMRTLMRFALLPPLTTLVVA